MLRDMNGVVHEIAENYRKGLSGTTPMIPGLSGSRSWAEFSACSARSIDPKRSGGPHHGLRYWGTRHRFD